MTIKEAYEQYKAAQPGKAIAAKRRDRSTALLFKADDGGSGSRYAYHLPPSITTRYREPITDRFGLTGTLRLMVEWSNS